jgi:RNA polymerase sigma-70 factor (ECF subfamily)
MGKLVGNSEFRERLAAARPRLYRTALAWTRNRDMAEDLVQETSTKALEKSKQLRDIGALNAWLFRIMINNWRDCLRQNLATEDIDNHEICTHHTPESNNSRLETINVVRSAVMQLPDAFKQTLMLVDLEGFSYIETASILNIPVGTVMSRLSRARSRLRDQLAQKMNPSANSRQPLRRIQ